MIDYGYRIYDGSDGALHFDQIFDGRVYPLEPVADDAKRKRGYYGPDFTYLGDGEPERPSATADVDYDRHETIDWEESEHKRGQPKNAGQFGPGGGGTQHGKTYVRAGEAGEAAPTEQQKKQPGMAAAAKGLAGKVLGGAQDFVAKDYEIVHEHFKNAKARPKDIGRVGRHLRSMAKALPQLLKAHLQEEKQHAVHAVGALKSLASGNRPSPEQVQGLRSFAVRALMISGSIALGDPTGSVGHLASTFGEEAVQHVIIEHALKLFVGGGMGALKGAVASAEKDAAPGEPPEPEEGDDAPEENGADGELGEEDIQLLQKFLESLAEAVEDMDEQDAHTVLFQGQTPDGEGDDEGQDGEAEDSERGNAERPRAGEHDDVDYPQTKDREWVEAEHPRGQPENAGQFAEGAGASAEHMAEIREGKGAEKEDAGADKEDEAAGKEAAAAGRAFVSPSVAEHLDFGAATEGLTSERQKLLSTASQEIDQALGLNSRSTSAIGAWSDGAENSIVTEMDGATFEQLKLAVAMKAALANQKAALVFQEAADGAAHLYHFEAKGNLDKIHQDLLEDGVEFHSIIPTKGGATVYAVDTEGSEKVADAIEKAAKRHGAQVTDRTGNAEFIGTDSNEGTADEQRHLAQLAYNKIIKGSGVPDAEAIWKRVRPTFGQAFEVTEFPKEPTTTPLPGSAPGSHPAVISSRQPQAVGTKPGDQYRRADLDGMKADARVFRDNMNLLKESRAYPQMRPEDSAGTPQQISRRAIDMAKSNLRFLYENAPEAVRTQGHLWYEGAHDLAAASAKQYNIPLQSAAGVYAALSPQKLWDHNVSLAEKVLDIYHNKQDHTWDPKMTDTASRIWKPKDHDLLRRVLGKKLSDLQLPAEKAMWIRTYDESHNAQGFQRLSPDGKRLGPYYNFDGSEAKGGWQNISSISNAITALESGGNREALSLSMGDRHKVRSFYNNILDPHSANQDVTMDTHAVGAALMYPSTSLSSSVNHSLATSPEKKKQPPGWKGASSSNVTGSSGTYGLWADAYRELAAELKIEPRVLQSVTWVAKRKLFDTRMTAETVRGVEAAWQEYHRGGRTLQQTQQEVLRLAGGMDKPDDGVPQPAAPRPPRAKKAKDWLVLHLHL